MDLGAGPECTAVSWGDGRDLGSEVQSLRVGLGVAIYFLCDPRVVNLTSTFRYLTYKMGVIVLAL